MAKPMPFNWETNRQMSDVKYARFLHIICDNGTFQEGVDFSTAQMYIKCSYAELKENQRRMRSFQYQFVLQKWDKSVAYVQFQITENVLQTDIAHLTERMVYFMSKIKDKSDGVTTNVKYLYVVVFGVPTSCAISTYLTESGLYKIMFEAARKFVIDNRPLMEISLFDEMYSSRGLPQDCFINFYTVGVTSGLKPHRDQSSFCSVVFCLLGNSDGKLVFTTECREEKIVDLKTNDMIVFGRITHYLQETNRTSNRITINAFF